MGLLCAGLEEGRRARGGLVRVMAVDPAVDGVDGDADLRGSRPDQPRGPASSVGAPEAFRGWRVGLGSLGAAGREARPSCRAPGLRVRRAQ
eukprot:5393955-Alexandrium_andersonii.AAC.1